MWLISFLTSPLLAWTIRFFFLVALGLPLDDPTVALLSLLSIAAIIYYSTRSISVEVKRLGLTRHITPEQYELKKKRLTRIHLERLQATDTFKKMKEWYENNPRASDVLNYSESPAVMPEKGWKGDEIM